MGNEKVVKVYDEETRAVIASMKSGTMMAGAMSPGAEAPSSGMGAGTGHSNRIFSVVWHPQEGEGNILASGGWDNTVQIWDLRCAPSSPPGSFFFSFHVSLSLPPLPLSFSCCCYFCMLASHTTLIRALPPPPPHARRVGHAVRSIYGPHLSGDGLAFTRDGKYLLSASWRTKNQLQVWDWARGALHLTLPWGESNVDCRESVEEASALAPHPQQTYDGGPRLYGVALSGASGLVLAGGSGVNEAKVWHLGEALRLGAAAAGAGAGGSGGGGSTAAPLVATVTGMERGVFALDWGPGGGMPPREWWR